MKKKRLPEFLVTVSFLILTGISSAQVMPEDAQLQELIREAWKQNPNLTGWSEQVAAAQKKISQMGALPDPMIMLGMMNLPTDSYDFNAEEMTGALLSVSQSIPITRRYGIQRGIATLDAEKTQLLYQNTKLNIARHIADTWYDWAYLQQSISTIDLTINLLDQILAIAGVKYETGHGMQQDLYKIKTERSRMLDHRVEMLQEMKTNSHLLAILLGREPSDVPNPPIVLEASFTTLEYPELDSLLFVKNPALKAGEKYVHLAEEQVKLNRHFWYPDLNLSAEYGFRQNADNGMKRPDFLSFSAGFSIPLFGSSKQGAAVAEAGAYKRQAEAMLREMQLQLRFELQTLLDRDSRLEKQMTIYQNEIIPQTQAALQASTATYSVGKTDLEALLMAQSTLYDTQLELFDRIRNRAKVRAGIAAMIGFDLN